MLSIKRFGMNMSYLLCWCYNVGSKPQESQKHTKLPATKKIILKHGYEYIVRYLIMPNKRQENISTYK